MAFGQSAVRVNIKAGPSSGNYWTMNGQDYPRGVGFFLFAMYPQTGDTVFAISYGNTRFRLIDATNDTFFYWQDSSKYCRNAAALQTWFRTNAY